MRTYVTATRAGTRLAHIGSSYWTACGFAVGPEFAESADVPDDRTVCLRCEDRYPRVKGSRYEAERRARHAEFVERTTRQIVALLCEGATYHEIARALDIAPRTIVRYCTAAQEAVGARSRFHWGYLLGLDTGWKSA